MLTPMQKADFLALAHVREACGPETDIVMHEIAHGEATIYRFTSAAGIATVVLRREGDTLVLVSVAGQGRMAGILSDLELPLLNIARAHSIRVIRAHTRSKAMARLHRRFFSHFEQYNGETVSFREVE